MGLKGGNVTEKRMNTEREGDDNWQINWNRTG